MGCFPGGPTSVSPDCEITLGRIPINAAQAVRG